MLYHHHCPTLAKGSKWHTGHVNELLVFDFEIIFYLTSVLIFFQAKFYAFIDTHPAKRCYVKHHDIPLASEEMTDTFCSFTRNLTFVTCFLLPCSRADHMLCSCQHHKLHLQVLSSLQSCMQYYCIKLCIHLLQTMFTLLQILNNAFEEWIHNVHVHVMYLQ